MKNFLVTLFVGMLVILSIGASCSKSNTPANTTPEAIREVSILKTTFDPTTVTIQKGTTVKWTNNDTDAHQIESDGNFLDLLSGELEPQESYSFNFNQSGTYGYHCKINPSLTGQVIVQ